jgi:hypothetical protein
MSDLHEWLAAARLGGYESLVREYAGELDDIAELTPGDVAEITEQIEEKVKKRKFAEAFEHAVEHSRRGASADVHAPAQGILPCLSGFVISSAIVLRSS